LAPNADVAMRADRRPSVLLLRSFADDVLTNGPVSFERSIQELVKHLGPFVAVGAPGNTRPAIDGAYRSYETDATWQCRVISFMETAFLIFVVPGTTHWIRWELSTIVGREFLRKTALIFPPNLSPADKEARLRATLSALEHDLDPAIWGRIDIARAIGIHFFAPGVVTVLVEGAFREPYEYSFTIAALEAERRIHA
jgi:hypothetical protein